MAIQSNFPAIKPSLMLDFANTKQLDSRITYTRASTASYYDGVTTSKAEENLLTYSQEFDNAAWTKSGTTVTANSIAAPDGTTTADTLSAAGTALNAINRLYTGVLTTGSVTASIYAKAGTKSVLQFGAYRTLTANSVDTRANFDLASGVLGSVDTSVLTASITSVGSGWYRCTVTWTRSTTAAGNGVWSMQDTTTAAWEATSTSGDLYIWGHQLEQRSAVTAYTATTTQAITNYIPKLQSAASGVARFDNNPTTGESLGLLIEESRSNLVTYSSQFDNAAWTKSNTTITADTVVSPDGTLTGEKIIANSTSAAHDAWQNPTVVSGTTYSASIYMKAGGYSKAQIFYFDSNPSNGASAIVDLGAVTISGSNFGSGTFVGASIVNVGNDWYRVVLTGSQSGSTSGQIRIRILNNAGSETFSGNGFDGLFIWGAQLEAGAFATSYIPTVASQVTRAADAASMTGTNFSTWFNAGEGTIYAETSGQSSGSGRIAYLSANNDVSNYYNLNFEPNSGRWYGAYNGTNQFNISITPYTNGSFAKLAGCYKVNDFAISFNNSSASTDTSGNLATGINQLNLGAYPTNSFMLNGTIKKLAYYPLRVTNAQLQALTS